MELALPFLGGAFASLLAEDALVVLGRGLGGRVLLARFLRHHCGAAGADGGDLVLVLNVPDAEARVVREMLEADGLPRALLPRLIEAGTSAHERARAYSGGGVIVFSNAQVLLADLMSGRARAGGLDPRAVSGIVVCRAHLVTETAQESFAVRKFKQAHPRGFVKALSEDAEELAAGFNRLEKTMRALHVRKLQLWPRFHQLVVEDLRVRRERGHQLEELTVDMTDAMLEVQRAIAACMDACIGDLRKAAPALAQEELTVQRSLFSAFDKAVQRQLAGLPGLGPAARLRANAAVEGLRRLRKLLMLLPRHDAVQFLEYVNQLRANNALPGHAAPWIVSPAGDRLHRAARSRVYTVDELPPAFAPAPAGARGGKGKAAAPAPAPPSSSSKPSSSSAAAAAASAAAAQPAFAGVGALLADGAPLIVEERAQGMTGGAPAPPRRWRLNTALEHNPKWAALAFVLRDMRRQWAQASAAAAAKRAGGAAVHESHDAAGPGAVVLVAAKDDATCARLRRVLSGGAAGAQAMLQDALMSMLCKGSAATRQQRAAVLELYGKTSAACAAALEHARAEAARVAAPAPPPSPPPPPTVGAVTLAASARACSSAAAQAALVFP